MEDIHQCLKMASSVTLVTLKLPVFIRTLTLEAMKTVFQGGKNTQVYSTLSMSGEKRKLRSCYDGG